MDHKYDKLKQVKYKFFIEDDYRNGTLKEKHCKENSLYNPKVK